MTCATSSTCIPVLGADGHFRLTLAFPRPALYHIYADATPARYSTGVFRFDVPIGGGGRVRLPSTVSGDDAKVGPYTVRLSEVRVAARQDVPLLVAVTRAGLPAVDLHPYLGAYAHVVMIGISDLSYVHARPMTPGAMDMAMGGGGASAAPLADSASVSATMTVHLRFPRPGLYKLWVQFRGGTALYAAPFVMRAS